MLFFANLTGRHSPKHLLASPHFTSELKIDPPARPSSPNDTPMTILTSIGIPLLLTTFQLSHYLCDTFTSIPFLSYNYVDLYIPHSNLKS